MLMETKSTRNLAKKVSQSYVSIHILYDTLMNLQFIQTNQAVCIFDLYFSLFFLYFWYLLTQGLQQLLE